MAKPRTDDRFFGPEVFPFLRELARNNNREWFQRNKARYEASVQSPALRFVSEMGARLGRFAPHVVADPRPFGGSLTRIYRDTRFSKDKSPYKTHLGIHFAHEAAAGSDRNLPGFYFHLAPGESFVAAGIWHPIPPDLAKIRTAIVAKSREWGRVLGRRIEIGGESYVRVPSGFDPNHPYADDLRRKDFFASREFRDSAVAGTRFGPTFEMACRELDPLNAFLAKALAVPW